MADHTSKPVPSPISLSLPSPPLPLSLSLSHQGGKLLGREITKLVHADGVRVSRSGIVVGNEAKVLKKDGLAVLLFLGAPIRLAVGVLELFPGLPVHWERE